MITRRTKVQLLIFVIITLVGVSFVGARYARLDRLVVDDAYTVVAHFSESGGIFADAEVTYRGVGIGRVEKLVLTDDGVDVHLGIENGYDEIPADTLAVVGNRSAVGEQYVELQPNSDSEPFLANDSEIAVASTRTPIATETLLEDLTTTFGSVDLEALQTTVTELGAAFGGAGEDLQRIIDTGNSFIEAADANFDITTALIEDSNVVLNGQIASESSIRNFSRQLALFSGTVAGADQDLRGVIDSGSFAANQLRTFLEDNRIELGSLINNLITTGEVVVKRLPGIKQIFVLYPYVVEGGFTVVSKTPKSQGGSGLFDAHFGAIMSETMPCQRGYEGTDRRTPSERFGNPPMNEDARCTEPPTMSNPRGAQNAPPRAGAAYRSPVVASYDPDSGQLSWGKVDPALEAPGSVAPRSLGEESWKWLFLEPMMAERE